MSTTLSSWNSRVVAADDLAWDLVPDGIPGAYRKVLDVDANGEPRVMLISLPAGLMFDHAHRHYHRSLDDFNLILGGSHPLFEYESGDQQHGTLTVWKAGYYLHRSAGSIHGIEPSVSAPVHCSLLHWRTKPGNWVGDPTYEEDTLQVPFASDWQPNPDPSAIRSGDDGVVLSWPLLREVDSREMPWEESDVGGGPRQKVLERDPAGEPLAQLICLSPGESAGSVAAGHECIFLLSGSLSSVDSAARPLVARRGSYAGREGTDELSSAQAQAPGAVVLTWRIPD